MAGESQQLIEDGLFVGIGGSVRQFTDSLNGLFIEVFEQPVRRINSNSIWLPILLNVIGRESEEVDAFAFVIDRIPEAVTTSTRH